VAIRINRVYTRTGDDGTTSLVGGARVPKTSLRIASYGDVDELNSVLGMARVELEAPEYARNEAAPRLDRTLAFLQQELFDLGAELATPPQAEYDGMIRIVEANVTRLENFIDELQPELEPLKSFVLPGGGRAGAVLHLARTVCRRAERTVSALVEEGETSPWTARYLNRLSDLLFVQSRWIAAKTGKPEALWQKGLEPPPTRRLAGREGEDATEGKRGQPKPRGERKG
jgi:cob(I)alamin adenosyltransferase